MQESAEPGVSRVERRKQRTRAALITAAQGFIAQGRLSVPVLDITQAADVGMGSFYNYFDSKEELFAVAVGEALDAHGALLDALTADIDDPAETFGCRFRLTGRLFRRRPQESQILLANGVALLTSDRGLAPRALRDIEAGVAAGMVTVACNWGYCGAIEPSTWGADYLLDTPTDLLQTLRTVVEAAHSTASAA